jgi:hypothetical protein
MPLRNLLKRKDKLDPNDLSSPSLTEPQDENSAHITFLRTTTTNQEVISPPQYPGDNRSPPQPVPSPSTLSPPKPNRHGLFHRQHGGEESGNSNSGGGSGGLGRSLSDRLHISSASSRMRSASSSSVNLPADLPAEPSGVAKGVEDEAEWEKRATLLAKGNGISRSNSPASQRGVSDAPSDVRLFCSASIGN